MTKRIQVILPDRDSHEIQRIARSRRISVSQWVRQVLHAAKRDASPGDVNKKLEALRTSATFEFPTADMEQLLGGIERDYLPKRQQTVILVFLRLNL